MLNKTLIRDTLNEMGRYFVGAPEQNRLSAFKRAPEQIHVSIPKGKPFVDDLNKTQPEQTEEPAAPIVIIKQEAAPNISAINLQDAIIWSEILGKPMCKRRHGRNRFL